MTGRKYSVWWVMYIKNDTDQTMYAVKEEQVYRILSLLTRHQDIFFYGEDYVLSRYIILSRCWMTCILKLFEKAVYGLAHGQDGLLQENEVKQTLVTGTSCCPLVSDEDILLDYQASEAMIDFSKIDKTPRPGRLDRAKMKRAPMQAMTQTLAFIRKKYGSVSPGYLQAIGFNDSWRLRLATDGLARKNSA